MTTVPQAKVFPISTAVNDAGHLVIGGCDLVDLAAEFGTPLYLYDEATLRAQAQGFASAFGSRYASSKVLYACKAFINVGLARLLSANGLGFDVVSGGELAVLRTAEVSPESVYFHGNNKTPQELREAVDWGIGRIVVDGFHELTLLEQTAAQAGRVQRVLIRVSPSIDPHTHRLTTTGVLDSKFGFPIETGQAREAVRLAVESPHLELRGLHFHLGSPIFETEPYEEAVGRVLAFASEMREEGLELSEFSPGGGFAIAYTEADDPPTPAVYAEAIVGALRAACAAYDLPEPELIIEPGRAVAGPAGGRPVHGGHDQRRPRRTDVRVSGRRHGRQHSPRPLRRAVHRRRRRPRRGAGGHRRDHRRQVLRVGRRACSRREDCARRGGGTS